MIRIQDIVVEPGAAQDKIKSCILQRLRLREQDLLSYKIAKKSIDARKKNAVKILYSVDVEVRGDENRVLKQCGDKKASIVMPYAYVPVNSIKAPKRPVVAGAGPAGLFAALVLAQAGQNPIILERGKCVEERKKDIERFFSGEDLNTESNVQFGEGGAGTFSDGKLTTGTKDPRGRFVLETFVEAGAPEEILYLSKPHIGTDKLICVIKNLRKRIIALGGEFLFGTKLNTILLSNGRVSGVQAEKGRCFETSDLVLAIGHSARDTFEMLYESGVPIEPKPFSVGVRIEHPQEFVDKMQYGSFAGHPSLGAADYKLAVHLPSGRGVYTFCMCPGGSVVAAASEKEEICTNGMSFFARAGQNANSAVLVGVSPEDFGSGHPLAGMYFQRKIEHAAYKMTGSYRAPAQLAGDFLNRRPSKGFGKVIPSYRPGVEPAELDGCLPSFIADSLREGIIAMDKKMRGFAMSDAVLTAPETRSSSPIRILRDNRCTSVVQGLYPCGEGSGYAGGIMSAAVDGIKCAEQILIRYGE